MYTSIDDNNYCSSLLMHSVSHYKLYQSSQNGDENPVSHNPEELSTLSDSHAVALEVPMSKKIYCGVPDPPCLSKTMPCRLNVPLIVHVTDEFSLSERGVRTITSVDFLTD